MHLHPGQDVIVFRGQLEGREGWLPDGLSRYIADTLEEGSPDLQNPSVPFHLISSSDIDRVLHQNLVPQPFIWVDKEEALEKGVASLRIATSVVGAAPTGKSSFQLPLKPILIQQVQGATNAVTSSQLTKATFSQTFRSILSINSMNLVYRIQHILFPILCCIRKELSAMTRSPGGGVTELYEGGVLPDGVGIKVTDQGLIFTLIEQETKGIGGHQRVRDMARLQVNLRHACVEVLTCLKDGEGLCPLMTVRSLKEAVLLLPLHNLPDAAHQDNQSPRNLSSSREGTARLYQSPAKPARRPGTSGEAAVKEGIRRISLCSSAHLREGTTAIQMAIMDGFSNGAEAVATAVRLSCTQGIPALVQAASRLLPSTLMGTTEQLTLLTLTINLILDADMTKIGVSTLIQALGDAYKTACANPLLLGKVTLALMERADVKTEAIHQGLCLAVAEAFRRKSALLEPLAASLVESAIAETEAETEAGGVHANGIIAKTRSTHETPSSVSITTINDQALPSPYSLRLPLTADTAIILGRTRATRRRLARLSKDRNAFGDESHAEQKLSMSSIGAKASLTQLANRLGALAVTSVLTPLLVCYRNQDAVKKSLTSLSGLRRNVPVTPVFSPSLAIQAHRIQTSSRSSSSSCNLEPHESDECSSMRTASSDLKDILAGKVEGSSKTVGVMEGGSCFVAAPDASAANQAKLVLLLDVLLAALPPPCLLCSSLPHVPLHVRGVLGALPLLIAHVLSSMDQREAESTGGQLRQRCLVIIARLSLFPPPPATSRSATDIFLAVLAIKLNRILLSRGKPNESSKTSPPLDDHDLANESLILKILDLAADYVMLVPSTTTAISFATHFARPLGLICDVLTSSGLEQISIECSNSAGNNVWQYQTPNLVAKLTMFQALLTLVTLVMNIVLRCELKDVESLAALVCFLRSLPFISAFPHPAKTAVSTGSGSGSGSGAMFRAACALLQAPVTTHITSIQRAILDYATCLAAIVIKIRKECIHLELGIADLVQTLVDPSHPGGVALALDRILIHPSLAAARLRPAVFRLVRTVLEAPDDFPGLSTPQSVSGSLQFHFARFLKLYCNPNFRAHETPYLCRQHLIIIRTLVTRCSRYEHLVRTTCFRLSILPFLVNELSLEYDFSFSREGGVVGLDVDVGSLWAESRGRSNQVVGQVVGQAVGQRTAGNIHVQDHRHSTTKLNGDCFHTPSVASTGQSNRDFAAPEDLPFRRGISNSLSCEEKITVALTPAPDPCSAAPVPGLERLVSAAISIDKEAGPFTTLDSTNSNTKHPILTGDLDEDVELLEALDGPRASESDDAISSLSEEGSDGTTESDVSSSSSSRSKPAGPHVPALLLTPTNGGTADMIGMVANDENDATCFSAGSLSKPRHQRLINKVPRLPVTPALTSTSKDGRSLLGIAATPSPGPPNHGVGSSPSLRTPTNKNNRNLSSERQARLVYRDQELHVQALVLIFALLIKDDGTLDASYCDRYPCDATALHTNILFILHRHLNFGTIVDIPSLTKELSLSLGPPGQRLLKTLCGASFRPEWYSNRARISGVAGAFATIHRCSLPSWLLDFDKDLDKDLDKDPKTSSSVVVIKSIDLPKHIQDRCSQVDFYSEASILETLKGYPWACQLYDYGIDLAGESMLLVLKEYRCSLKQWRSRQDEDPAPNLGLYYAIFHQVVAAVKTMLEEAGVIHFDLKCDNVLLEPLGTSASMTSEDREHDLWSPPSPLSPLPFRIVLADFGESKLVGSVDEQPPSPSRPSDDVTVRARGTDACKSPEMLLVGGGVQISERAYDRRKRKRNGAGAASDVWSLGCLLYELITGKMLFDDGDWLQLVARVTSDKVDLIPEGKAAAVAHLPGVSRLLHSLLIRDPAIRPTIGDVLHMMDAVIEEHWDDLWTNSKSCGMNSDKGDKCCEDECDAGHYARPSERLFWPSMDGINHAISVHENVVSPVQSGAQKLPSGELVIPLFPGLSIGPLPLINSDPFHSNSLWQSEGIRTVAVLVPGEYENVFDVALADHLGLGSWIDASCLAGVSCTTIGIPWTPDSMVGPSELAQWCTIAMDRCSNMGDKCNSQGRRSIGDPQFGLQPDRLLIAQAAPDGHQGMGVLLAIAWAVIKLKWSLHETFTAVARWGLDGKLERQHREAAVMLCQHHE